MNWHFELGLNLTALQKWCCFVLFVVSLSSFSVSSTENGAENPEKVLIEHLMSDYSPEARPAVTDPPGGPVLLGIRVYLKRVVELDVKNQVLTTVIWLSMEWRDEQLQWDPKDFGNLTDIRLPAERVWKPDLELYNSADHLTSLSDGTTPLVIKKDGTVSWIEPKEVKTTCGVDATFFRFDTQTCELKIGSWTHDGLKVDIKGGSALDHTAFDRDEIASKGEWKVVEGHMLKSTKIYPGYPEPYIDITATLVIRRRSLFFVLDTIFPLVIMSVILLFTFQLPPDRYLELRVLLEITVSLVFCTYLWHETGNVPEGHASVTVIYMAIMMLLGMASVLGTLIVWKLDTTNANVHPWPNCFKNCLSPDYIMGKHRNSRDNIPLTEHAFMESTNQFDTTSVASLVVDGPGTATSQQRGQSENCNVAVKYKLIAQQLDRIVFLVFGTIAFILNSFILLLAVFR